MWCLYFIFTKNYKNQNQWEQSACLAYYRWGRVNAFYLVTRSPLLCIYLRSNDDCWYNQIQPRLYLARYYTVIISFAWLCQIFLTTQATACKWEINTNTSTGTETLSNLYIWSHTCSYIHAYNISLWVSCSRFPSSSGCREMKGQTGEMTGHVVFLRS